MNEIEKTLLSLDMSTSCTGYSLFDIDSKKLLTYGILKPSTKGGIAKMAYPKQQLTKMIDLANQMLNLVRQYNPSTIVIEEIAGSKNRLGQKTLDGLHYIVAWVLQDYLDRFRYYDVTGNAGWRYHLQLKLDDADKASNKEAKVLNKKLSAAQRIPIIGPKHLAVRYVNSHHGLCLNFDTAETDGDIADSVAMGSAFLKYRFAELSR